MTTPPSDAVGPGETLFRFVRYWSRRWTGAGHGVDQERGRDVMVVEAVRSTAPRSASIRDVAEQLGLDHSGASRLVSRAVSQGYLLSSRHPDDQRQRVLTVTDSGDDLIRQAHQWQEEIFARLAADWTSDEIEVFRSLMHRLARVRD